MSEGGETIIIRKKRSSGEEEHHGGVWKLAFADFMTAMMAFFLVMWLINSTSKETKAVIVQYFNPVQLIDANPAHKGLRDPKETGQGKSLQHADDAAEKAQEPGPKEKDKEAALHKDPLKALDDIASQEPAETAPPSESVAASAVTDPFDRSPPAPPPSHAEEKKPPSAAAKPPPKQETSAQELQAEFDKIVGHEAGKLHAGPHVDVARTGEGILISLTDDAHFSMFGVGSIEPRPQLVRIITEIGKTLAKQHGEIEIRGHTDARSYASANYDNWRLSSDRATIVNYMLIRGGVAAQRIGKIVGYADRKLKAPKEPLSPVNRRIEILLRGDAP